MISLIRELIEGGSNLALYGVSWNTVLWIFFPFNMHHGYSGDTVNTLSEHDNFNYKQKIYLVHFFILLSGYRS